MKFIVGLALLYSMLSFGQEVGLYNIALKNIDGNPIQLSRLRGKKLLFILLPISTEDTTVRISDISHLQTVHQNSLVIIGVPSVEAGYKAENTDKLRKEYKDASVNFIIAEGMKVTKGPGQSPLFKWLTSKNMNHHFNRDVQGIGSKFFVDEVGELYGVMGPKLTLTNPLIDRILNRARK